MRKVSAIILVMIIVGSFYGCDPMSDTDQTRDESMSTMQETGTENTSISDDETTIQDKSENTDTSTSSTEDTTVENTETTIQDQSECTDTSTYSTETTDEIILDKTYHNKRFDFEFNYPSIWILVEEKDISDSPNHGAILFIDDTNVDQTPIINLDRTKDFIFIFGCESNVHWGEKLTGEFTTDDGVEGLVYYHEYKGKMITDISFQTNEYLMYGYAAIVNVSSDINDKFGEVIMRILKSIKLPTK
jgi:hypothetical protein